MCAVPNRLWRLRKLHQYVDAELVERGAEAAAIRVLYNGELSYVREWPTRREALADAAARRADLERDGWSFHW
jgi:hypothetical protein